MSHKRTLPGGLHPAMEAEIYTLLDRAIQLDYEEPLVYSCSASRANYLYRHITGEIFRNAYESVVTYPEDSPLYGKGLYFEIELGVISQGLLLTRLQAPKTSALWLMLQCYAERQRIDLTCKTRQILTKVRNYMKKYPYITNRVLVQQSATHISFIPIEGMDTPLPDIDGKPQDFVMSPDRYKRNLI